jgi:hypothetical protein
VEWEKNIQIHLKEIGLQNVDRIYLAWGADRWLTLSKAQNFYMVIIFPDK